MDTRRFAALQEEKGFSSLNLREVIRKRQLTTLILNLLLSSYQRRIGLTSGTLPGTEFLEAAKTADEMMIPIVLCDRDIRITLIRAWRSLQFWERFRLLSEMVESCVSSTNLSESDLQQLRNQNVLNQVMTEFSKRFPNLKRILIDERDVFLAKKMRESSGNRIVSIVGAGHVKGIQDALNNPNEANLTELSQIPPRRPWFKIFGWTIPIVIVLALSTIGLQKGASALQENLIFWILINGTPSAICTALAMGNPLTIVAAFIFAPFTSLTPVIGVGYVTAFVQAYVRSPRVEELESAANDATNLKGWFQNKLLRIFLVFIFSSLGSVFGTWAGGAKLISSIF